jgi:hypothetical protein
MAYNGNITSFGGLMMDIPALSIAMNQMNLGQAVGLRVLGMVKEQAEQQGQQLAQMLKQKVQPHVGGHIDIHI